MSTRYDVSVRCSALLDDVVDCISMMLGWFVQLRLMPLIDWELGLISF